MSRLEVSVLFGKEAQSPMGRNLSFGFIEGGFQRMSAAMHHHLQKRPANDNG